MNYANLSFLVPLVLMACTNAEEKAKEDIFHYYVQSSRQAGAAQVRLTKVDIIKVDGTFIKAYVQGYSSNNSLAKPIKNDFSDTLFFEYYNAKNDLKIVSSTP